MKRLLTFLLAITMALIMAPAAWALGTVAVTYTETSHTVQCIIYTWVADATDKTVPATASAILAPGYIVLGITDPGTTAPTDNYSITVTDAHSIDVFGGSLASRDTANAEAALTKPDGTNVKDRYFQGGTLTINLSGNSVASATGVLRVYIERK